MKPRTFLIFLAGLTSFCTFAQSSQFQIGGSTSYLYSYRSLVSNGSTGDFVKDSRDKSESGASGVGLSGDLTFSMKGKFYLRSALSVNNFGYTTQTSRLKFGDAINDSTGFANPSTPISTGKINQRFITLSIPVLIGYKIHLDDQNTRFLLIQTGLNNHLILSSKTKGEYRYQDGTIDNRTTNTKTSFNSYYLSSLTGIGYLYQPNKHGISVALFFDYGLTPINKNTTNISQHSYFGGVNLSYCYNIGEK